MPYRIKISITFDSSAGGPLQTASASCRLLTWRFHRPLPYPCNQLPGDLVRRNPKTLPPSRPPHEMPPVTAADATLILDHVLGDRSVPTVAVQKLLAALPSPSNPTPRLRRALLLRHLADDPVSASALQDLRLLASLPATASAPASCIAAAHVAVAAFLADFDAAAARATAEERVRDLLAAEWAAIEPSKLELAAERIVGDGAVQTWRAADEPTRAKFRILAGEEKTREILPKLEEPTSGANPISTPAFERVIDRLKTSCADLHSVVEDPLPAAKAVADELLAARMDKGVSLNAEQLRGQPTTCGAAGPSALNDKDQGPSRGKLPNLMDRNPTARTSQWEDSPNLDGLESSLRRPHLSSPRRLPTSPLPPPENKSNRRKTRKWSVLEEQTLREGVQQYGFGNWKVILDNNRDVLFGRTAVDLKDKWRSMNPFGQR